MKTTNTTTANIDNLTEGQLKAMALMEFNGTDYFMIDEEDTVRIFQGNEEEARADFLKDIEGTEEAEIDANFIIFCSNNLTEVEEIVEDEERDGYIVLTDEEADEMAANYIKDSLWAFNSGFIIDHSKLPYEAKEMIETYQQDKCESANETIEALIEDLDEFIEDAISADGRGHFMSSYDGNEHEQSINGGYFYIYRMN